MLLSCLTFRDGDSKEGIPCNRTAKIKYEPGPGVVFSLTGRDFVECITCLGGSGWSVCSNRSKPYAHIITYRAIRSDMCYKTESQPAFSPLPQHTGWESDSLVIVIGISKNGPYRDRKKSILVIPQSLRHICSTSRLKRCSQSCTW